MDHEIKSLVLFDGKVSLLKGNCQFPFKADQMQSRIMKRKIMSTKLADKAGLFYKMALDQMLKFKGEKCINKKLSKVRKTVFICTSVNGSEKQKLIVIDKSQKPMCFKNVKITHLKTNQKFWMTSNLFEEHR